MIQARNRERRRQTEAWQLYASELEVGTKVERVDLARDNCRSGWHMDPDNSGMCIYCKVILDPEPGEDPNSYRRQCGWSDVPLLPTSDGGDD